MWGSSIGTIRSSSESIRKSHVLPLREDPKIQASRPGSSMAISGRSPSGTVAPPSRTRTYRSQAVRTSGRLQFPSDGSTRSAQSRPDQEDETDQDANDANRVVHENGDDDPDHYE